LDFSFSGLKTAVRYRIAGTGTADWSSIELSPSQRADIAAGFQQAVVDCLVGKALLALKQTSCKRLCVGGGVAANRLFRQQLQIACEARGIEWILADTALCTDNAVMGALAWERLQRGECDALDLDAQPGLIRHPTSRRT
jgi:N6-L-threonylcarbamoyladenine synthase